jgi:hypothetical protein
MTTLLDKILEQVKTRPGRTEITFDAVDWDATTRDRVIEAAKARGLHVSGTDRWILVRAL